MVLVLMRDRNFYMGDNPINLSLGFLQGDLWDIYGRSLHCQSSVTVRSLQFSLNITSWVFKS